MPSWPLTAFSLSSWVSLSVLHYLSAARCPSSLGNLHATQCSSSNKHSWLLEALLAIARPLVHLAPFLPFENITFSMKIDVHAEIIATHFVQINN